MSTYSHSSAEGHEEVDMDDAEPGQEPGAAPGAAGEPVAATSAGHRHTPSYQQHYQQPGQHAPAPYAAAAAVSSQSQAAAAASSSSSSPLPYIRPSHWPLPTLHSFLLNTDLNALLSSFLVTRDLFLLQFLNRGLFTLLNSHAGLLQCYYATARLDSFIPFMVDDSFVHSFLTPTYLALPDGGTAVRNTYSMHIKHLRLDFCTRISDRALQLVAQHIGPRLLSVNLEGGGRSRITDAGMRTLFAACNNLTAVNLNGCFQLSMESTVTHLIQHCGHSLTSLSLNGCSPLTATALGQLSKAKLQRLSLNCCNVSDAILEQIAQSFPRLSALHIGYCGAITDRGLAALVHYCRQIEDLNLYGCNGLSRHALSYLRLLPLLHTVDISRIHSLDDGSIAQWVLPTRDLQAQQAAMQQQAALVAATLAAHGGGGAGLAARGAVGASAGAGAGLDSNPNLPQILSAQQAHVQESLRQQSTGRLRSVSLDSCSRLSALGLKVLIEQCPSLTSLNAFGIQNVSLVALQSLLRIAVSRRSPLRQLQVGGCATLHPRDMEAMRREFASIQF